MAGACEVLIAVNKAIEDKTATYGDLSWAQEALHDISFSDGSGTSSSDFMTASKTDKWESVGVFCSSTAEVFKYADALPEGGQLICVAWRYLFNDAFHDAG